MLISCKPVARDPLLRFSADAGVLSSSTGSLLTAAGEMVSSGFEAMTGETGASDAAIALTTECEQANANGINTVEQGDQLEELWRHPPRIKGQICTLPDSS